MHEGVVTNANALPDLAQICRDLEELTERVYRLTQFNLPIEPGGFLDVSHHLLTELEELAGQHG
jgi:hypothetical protein